VEVRIEYVPPGMPGCGEGWVCGAHVAGVYVDPAARVSSP